MDYPTRTIHHLQNHKGKTIMEYLTFILLFIAAVAGVTATALAILHYIKPNLTWVQPTIWFHADICRYALWSALATGVLELYL
jgi:hypothetical protein